MLHLLGAKSVVEYFIGCGEAAIDRLWKIAWGAMLVLDAGCQSRASTLFIR
jgi:hypothetical protein